MSGGSFTPPILQEPVRRLAEDRLEILVKVNAA